MNAGEPPDETGENEVDESQTDPESGDTSTDEDGTDPHEDEAVDGDGDDDLDPGQEVEAAVEEVMGPGVLDDGEDGDGGEGEDGDEDEDGASTGGDSPSVDGAPSVNDDADDVIQDGPSADGEEPADGDEIDESAAAEAAKELVDSVEAEEPAATEGADGAAETEAGESGAETEEVAEIEGAGNAPETVEADDAVEVEDTTEARDTTEAEGAEDPQEAGGVDEPREADGADESQDADEGVKPAEDVPADVRKYDRFKKIDGGTYDRANEFLRDRTYITAREWAMARLCADFRTETGVEMTKIGNNLPELVPFMTDTYTPQAVNQARAAFEEKVRKAGATFLYGAMCDFFTAEELDDVMYEATEVAKFLLEVEGVELSVEEELAAEDHISEVMRDVREHSAALRHDEVTCPECGHEIGDDD